jgi:16S rRNA A1518/A1519 N6-dimethyltransferase RsmA/KsgA/DIM1 with predicted DNA glycosylase/AP lyase activity
VESVVVRLKPVPPRLDAEHERLFLKMVRAAFGQDRDRRLTAGETLGLEEFLEHTS